MSVPSGSLLKTLLANAGDAGLMPGSGRSLGDPLEKDMATHGRILA